MHLTKKTGDKDMTRSELVAKIADDASISKAKARLALDSILDGVKQALNEKNGKITLRGFGTFSTFRRKARSGINPQTGDTIEIKEHTAVRFRASKRLK